MPPKHEKASSKNQNVHGNVDAGTGTITLIIWKSFSKCRAGITINPTVLIPDMCLGKIIKYVS